MWLTVIFADLCICTCILTPTPPMAPAHPHFIMQFCALCNVMTQVKAEIVPHIHQHTEGIHQIKHLLVYDNCYAISCHHLWCSNWGSFHTEGVLQSRCSFTLPLHRRWSCHISTSRVYTRSLRSSGLPMVN